MSRKQNPEFELAPPPASSMIEALRGVGYSTETAIADLIDNSISAGANNVWINFWWAGRDSYVSTLDDGKGGTLSVFVIYAVGNRIFRYSDQSAGGSFSGASTFDNSLCELSASPNRRDGRTTITYTVPEDANVQITIYERGGLIHDRIIDEPQPAGTHTIEYTFADDAPTLYASIVTGLYRQRIKLPNQP